MLYLIVTEMIEDERADGQMERTTALVGLEGPFGTFNEAHAARYDVLANAEMDGTPGAFVTRLTDQQVVEVREMIKWAG